MPRETIARLVEGRVNRAGGEINNMILWQAACIPPDHELRTWSTRYLLCISNIVNKTLQSIECCGDLRRVIAAQVEILQDEINVRGYNHSEVLGPEFSSEDVMAKDFVRYVKTAQKKNAMVEVFSSQEGGFRCGRRGLNKNDTIYLEKILDNLTKYNVRIHPYKFTIVQVRENAFLFNRTTLKM